MPNFRSAPRVLKFRSKMTPEHADPERFPWSGHGAALWGRSMALGEWSAGSKNDQNLLRALRGGKLAPVIAPNSDRKTGKCCQFPSQFVHAGLGLYLSRMQCLKLALMVFKCKVFCWRYHYAKVSEFCESFFMEKLRCNQIRARTHAHTRNIVAISNL